MKINTSVARTTTEIEVMQACARDSNPDVRYSLTLNPETTIEILSLLVDDPDSDVRESARHRLSGASTQFDKYEVSSEIRSTFFMVTTDLIPGAEITKTIGLVSGTSSKMALGVNKQSERLDLALNSALVELELQAKAKGANAVVGIHVTANSSQGASAAFMGSSDGVLAVGTAVVADFPEP